MLQSLAVTEIKGIADSLLRRVDNADGSASFIPTAESEAVRTALQGLVGCAGAAAGGGDCGSAATGAAASVVINNLISAIDTGFEEPRYDPITEELLNPTALEEQQARTNLVATIIGAIAEGAGLDTPDAITAAQIETENNQIKTGNIVLSVGDPEGKTPEEIEAEWRAFFDSELGKTLTDIFGSEELVQACRGNASEAVCQEAQKRVDQHLNVNGGRLLTTAVLSQRQNLEQAIRGANGPEVSGESIQAIRAGL